MHFCSEPQSTRMVLASVGQTQSGLVAIYGMPCLAHQVARQRREYTSVVSKATISISGTSSGSSAQEMNPAFSN